MPAPSMPRTVGRLVTAALAATATGVGLLGVPVLAYGDSTPTPTPTPVVTTTAPSPSTASTPTERATEAPRSSPTTTPSVADLEDTPDNPGKPGSDESEADAGEKTDAGATPSSSAASGAGDSVAGNQQLSSSEVAADQVQGQAEAPAAGISLTKTASPNRVSKVGQVITYRFVATNTGAVELANVAITDELDGLSRIDCPQPAKLPQHGSALTCTATLTVTQDWLDFGDIDNSATVFAEFGSEGANDYVGANASAHVAVDQRPSIAIDAAVSPAGTADAGDRLRYSATATNTGNVTLTAARITSSLDDLDLDCEPSARAKLSPGESVDCSGSYRVSRSDARRGLVSNLLTAHAEGPYGDSSTRSDDVTDDTRLRVAVNKPAEVAADSGLADTGGPALPIGVLGLAALLVGGGLLRRAGRR